MRRTQLGVAVDVLLGVVAATLLLCHVWVDCELLVVGFWIVRRRVFPCLRSCGGLGLGSYKRDYNYGAIIAGIFVVVVGWIIFFPLLQARKRIARSLTPNQLQDFVVGSVLIYGGMKLSGLLYLTAQGYKCLQEDVKDCSATTFPVMSISIMIFMILVYRLAILPLATAPTTRSQVGSFRNITMKNRASMLGLLVAGAGNCFLFSSIKVGIIEKPMWYLTHVVLAAIVFVMLVELIAIIRYQSVRRRQTIAVESGATPPPPPSTTSTPKSKSRNTDDTNNMLEAVAGGGIV